MMWRENVKAWINVLYKAARLSDKHTIQDNSAHEEWHGWDAWVTIDKHSE